MKNSGFKEARRTTVRVCRTRAVIASRENPYTSERGIHRGFGSGAAGKPRQVLFSWGKGLATYRGRLSADNVDVYLVQARAGDLLNAQLERVSVEDASICVVQQAGSRVLSAAGPAGSDARRLWAGKVPSTGEYRVEVVRRGAYCDPSVNDLLKVSLE
jgi:hypothetical protein